MKQPSSPDGIIASFLNSLFNQTSLKKKKKSKTGSGGAGKNFEEESHGGKRKRRSSINHFRITAAADKASSGFRTLLPYANTPTKSYKEFARFAADHHAVSLPVNGGNLKPSLNLEEKKPRVSEKMLKNVGNLIKEDGI